MTEPVIADSRVIEAAYLENKWSHSLSVAVRCKFVELQELQDLDSMLGAVFSVLVIKWLTQRDHRLHTVRSVDMWPGQHE